MDHLMFKKFTTYDIRYIKCNVIIVSFIKIFGDFVFFISLRTALTLNITPRAWMEVNMFLEVHDMALAQTLCLHHLTALIEVQ